MTDLRSRPGARLLELLEACGWTLADLATELGADNVRHAVANLRRYTHAGEPRWPGPAVVEEWARVLQVDPGAFYERAKKD